MNNAVSIINSIAYCPSCTSNEKNQLFDLKGDQVVQCKRCCLVYSITPTFNKLKLYEASYFDEGSEAGYENYANEFITHSSTFSRRLCEAEHRLGGPKTILDFGCALGHLGKVAKERGWNVFATDVSLFAVKKAVHNHDLKGVVSDIVTPPVKNAKFDLITIYDIIEHVHNPKEVLEQLRPMLKPSGLLHITTPNIASLTAKLMGTSWYHYKPQEHLIYFSPKTLPQMLENCGYEVIQTRSAPSFMTLYDIFYRLQKYSKWGAGYICLLLKFFGLKNWVVKIHIGEMQVWAKPKIFGPVLADNSITPKGLLDILCCITCQGNLKKEENQLVCSRCKTKYNIVEGIPVMLKQSSKKIRKFGKVSG